MILLPIITSHLLERMHNYYMIMESYMYGILIQNIYLMPLDPSIATCVEKSKEGEKERNLRKALVY